MAFALLDVLAAVLDVLVLVLALVLVVVLIHALDVVVPVHTIAAVTATQIVMVVLVVLVVTIAQAADRDVQLAVLEVVTIAQAADRDVAIRAKVALVDVGTTDVLQVALMIVVWIVKEIAAQNVGLVALVNVPEARIANQIIIKGG